MRMNGLQRCTQTIDDPSEAEDADFGLLSPLIESRPTYSVLAEFQRAQTQEGQHDRNDPKRTITLDSCQPFSSK